MIEVGDIRLLDIASDRIEDWDCSGATHVRVSLPSDGESLVAMQQRGFVFADRTLGVEIATRLARTDLESFIRFDATMSPLDHRVSFDIARLAFVGDSRFYIDPFSGVEHAQEVAEWMLDRWIKDAGEALVVEIEGALAGFLVPEVTDEGNLFVKLAAVEPRYRVTGVALSLYASALKRACELGCAKIQGRISSRNVAVANLYAYLGAKFTEPQDVFLRKLDKIEEGQ